MARNPISVWYRPGRHPLGRHSRKKHKISSRNRTSVFGYWNRWWCHDRTYQRQHHCSNQEISRVLRRPTVILLQVYEGERARTKDTTCSANLNSPEFLPHPVASLTSMLPLISTPMVFSMFPPPTLQPDHQEVEPHHHHQRQGPPPEGRNRTHGTRRWEVQVWGRSCRLSHHHQSSLMLTTFVTLWPATSWLTSLTLLTRASWSQLPTRPHPLLIVDLTLARVSELLQHPSRGSPFLLFIYFPGPLSFFSTPSHSYHHHFLYLHLFPLSTRLWMTLNCWYYILLSNLSVRLLFSDQQTYHYLRPGSLANPRSNTSRQNMSASKLTPL